MPVQIGVNVGFITNSSSVVYHFPVELLEFPEIAAFLRTYEVEGGFVGRDMWSRSRCGSLAVTRDQKDDIRCQLVNSDYGHVPEVTVDDDTTFVIVFGDEYHDMASILAGMLREVCETVLGFTPVSQSYN